MHEVIWLVPAIPFAGFVCLALFGEVLSQTGQAAVGVGSIGLSAMTALALAVDFLSHPPASGAITQVLWSWMRIGGFAPDIAFRIDSLSLVMILVVTVVGFLIHLYAAEFIAGDAGYRRFFAYMNLFVAALLVLVLADNLVFLYLGWEGVGLCSYLLIGFWYDDPANGAAARKAFFITRIGDAALLVGFFLLFANLGTLQIQPLLRAAMQHWTPGAGVATAAALLLLAGAVGKSAQLPLQTWLPDAMAGPTPVSALIHAATMVTAGVYLIARTHTLFELAPAVEKSVAVVGAATLLISACSGLVQTDIKRILAYSTISQIGYMFLALGVGAWGAAIFHLMTHAFFKSTLFMAAGVVINALDHEHDIFRMGGLRHRLPWAYWTFLISGASLAAVPLVTAGFYSKDLILWRAWNSGPGGVWLWLAGIVGALLTAMYIFRLIFVVFFGEMHMTPTIQPRLAIKLPLAVLSVLSLVAGFLEMPRGWGSAPLLLDFLHRTLPAAPAAATNGTGEAVLQALAATISLGGIYIAWILFGPARRMPAFWSTVPMSGIGRFWLAGWRFDALYDRLIVSPFTFLARVNADDVVDDIYQFVICLSRELHSALSLTENGRLRWYATGITAGSIALVAIMVFA